MKISDIHHVLGVMLINAHCILICLSELELTILIISNNPFILRTQLSIMQVDPVACLVLWCARFHVLNILFSLGGTIFNFNHTVYSGMNRSFKLPLISHFLMTMMKHLNRWQRLVSLLHLSIFLVLQFSLFGLLYLFEDLFAASLYYWLVSRCIRLGPWGFVLLG